MSYDNSRGGYHGSSHNSSYRGGGGGGGGYSSYNRQPRLNDHVGAAQNLQQVATQWNFYKPQEPRPEAEIAEWLQKERISLYGDRVPQPMFEFSDLVAPDAVHQGLLEAGFAKPTPIQSVSWPILLNGRDMVGVAKTGSGKTMGFMIPCALHIMAQPPLKPGDGPIGLVLAPTRELAVQIEGETKKVLRRVPGLLSSVVYGGTPKGPQMQALRAGVHVLIATPGRLIDHLQAGATNLLRVTYLVLDEADRMLDMGFEDQIRNICSQIRADRQTLMFSATWPPEIRSLAASYQRDVVRVHVGSEELTANADVRQHVLVVSHHGKQQELQRILTEVGQQRVLIFVKTKRTADALHDSLRRSSPPGTSLLVIHGDKMQSSRDFVLERFRRDAHSILVATDVAARGLDIKDLDVVINYDMPLNIEDYVHRIGRTGRAGKTGDSYTFVCSDDAPKTVRALIDILNKAGQEVTPGLYALTRGGGGGGGYRGGGYRGGGGGRGGYRGGQRGGYGGAPFQPYGYGSAPAYGAPAYGGHMHASAPPHPSYGGGRPATTMGGGGGGAEHRPSHEASFSPY